MGLPSGGPQTCQCGYRMGRAGLHQGLHGLSRPGRHAQRLLDAHMARAGSKLSRSRRKRKADLALASSVPACASLAGVDYSFYQALAPHEITEEYLWFERLLPVLGYLVEQDRRTVRHALSMAFAAHAGQRRKSGEPFITHPVEVTCILAGLEMDHESLCSGLLHDTVEDTEALTFADIEDTFGPAVRRIVEGETRFSKISKASNNMNKADLKAVDLQQLFLAMTEEVRIIVVKLADRLHNMRTLGSMKPAKQGRIAQETLQIFAPLARLLGLYSIKQELEDLSFLYSEPDKHRRMHAQLAKVAAQQAPAVQKAQQCLQHALSEDAYIQTRTEGVEVEIQQKAAYSIFSKLKERGGSIEDVRDVAQLCIVMQPARDADAALIGSTDAQLCYHAMGLVHTKWAPIPGSFKDYIATPKANGYQSLHTTVLPLGSADLFPLELQIRTAGMHHLAEFGIAGENWVAAHTVGSASMAAAPMAVPHLQSSSVPESLQQGAELGGLPIINGAETGMTKLNKQHHGRVNGRDVHSIRGTTGRQGYGGRKLNSQTMARRINWLNSIREWQYEFVGILSAQEFVTCVTEDLLGRGVFVFTPSGEIMRLPQGATIVDFAYHVHTDVGNQMIGARVQGKMVTVSHELANAEVVEVLMHDGPPTRLSLAKHREWLDYAQTRSARHKLLKFLRDHEEEPQAAAAAGAGQAYQSAQGGLRSHRMSDAAGGALHGLQSHPTLDEDWQDEDDAADPVPAPPYPGRSAAPGGELAQEGGGAAKAPVKLTDRAALVVKCEDKAGMLAKVSGLIAEAKFNIEEYSGSCHSDYFEMQFCLRGVPERMESLRQQVDALSLVRECSMSCSLSLPDPT